MKLIKVNDKLKNVRDCFDWRIHAYICVDKFKSIYMNLTIDDKPKTEKPTKPKPVIIATGVASPVESIKTSLESIVKVFTDEGTINPISKEDISKKLGKKTATLILTFSTWGQYGIVNNVRGTGYLPSSLYTKYVEKTYDHHEREALLQMFKNPPLYAKLIENLNGQQLPSEEKFQNILKEEPYKVNPNAAERAAKVFYENIRDLKLLDNNNRFRFSLNDTGKESQRQPEGKPLDKPKTDTGEVELFELPIPLTNKKTAYLKYPRESLTIKDIAVIRKAIDFIASSIGGDDDPEG